MIARFDLSVVLFKLRSPSTIFESFQDGPTISLVFDSTMGSLKCLALGHDKVQVGSKLGISGYKI